MAENKALDVVSSTTSEGAAHDQAFILAKKIEQRYQEGTVAYATTLQRYSSEIAGYQNKILQIEKHTKEAEENLATLEERMRYNEKLLVRLNEQFAKQVHIAEALQAEYTELVDEKAYATMKQRKVKELQAILDEIDELEMTLLHQELERLNMLAMLLPERKEREGYEEALALLQLEKEQFESMKIHQIHQLGMPQETTPSTEEVVEADII